MAAKARASGSSSSRIGVFEGEGARKEDCGRLVKRIDSSCCRVRLKFRILFATNYDSASSWQRTHLVVIYYCFRFLLNNQPPIDDNRVRRNPSLTRKCTLTRRGVWFSVRIEAGLTVFSLFFRW
jgi:hypothetical protein